MIEGAPSLRDEHLAVLTARLSRRKEKEAFTTKGTLN